MARSIPSVGHDPSELRFDDEATVAKTKNHLEVPLNAGRVLTRLALGAMVAGSMAVASARAESWPMKRAVAASPRPQNSDAPSQHTVDPALQAAYQGTLEVATDYGRAIQAAMAQMSGLLQALAQKTLRPGDRYTLIWSRNETYPVSIVPLAQSGLSGAAIADLATRHAWVRLQDATTGEVVETSVYDAKDRVVLSVSVPLAKFTGPLDGFKLGQDGRCFVLDAAGNVLNNPGGQILGVERKALMPMLTTDDGTLETHSYILSFARVAEPDWFLVVQLPKSEAAGGLTFPSDQEVRMELPLDPPQQIVADSDFGPVFAALGAGAAIALLAALVIAIRRRAADAGGDPLPSQPLDPNLPAGSFDLDEIDLDGPMPTDRDRLGKSARRWTSGIEEIPIQGDTPMAVANRVQMALRHQAKDQERMLGQLQHSLELTIADTRDQVNEILGTHQGRLKALAAAFEQMRSQFDSQPDPAALSALVEDVKTKLFDNESDSRTAMSGVEKRLSTLTRKFSDLEDTLGKAVLDIQGRLSEDLFGRQDEINRTMEGLESRTREVLRQVSHDSANAKVEGSKAAQIATELEADFQELKGRLGAEMDEIRRQAASDVSSVRAQVAAMEDIHAELKDITGRFFEGQADWEDRARQLSRKVTEDLADMQQRIFDREGDVEKIRIVMDQTIDRVHRQSEDLDSRRQRLERDIDNLKGKVFLQEEEAEKLKAHVDARLTELFASVTSQADKFFHFEQLGVEFERRVTVSQAKLDAELDALHQWQQDTVNQFIGDLERRFSAHIGETERRASEAISQALSSTVARIAQLDAVREYGEGQIRKDIDELENRLKVLLTEAEDRQVTFRSELRAGRDRDEAKITELEDKVYRAEVRVAQERAGLEDRLVGEARAEREKDLAAMREEAAWQRYQEAETRQRELEALRAELRGEMDALRGHQGQIEQAIGELARRMASELAAARERDDSASIEAHQISSGIADLRNQMTQEAATTQDMFRRIEERMQNEASGLAELTGRTEQLVASALTALPDHPQLIGLHRDIEHLSQEAYRTRADAEQFKDRVEDSLRRMAEQHTEQYTKVTNLMQLVLKLYESARESDEQVTKVLSTHASKVEGLHQEILAIRSLVAPRAASGAPVPLP